MLGGSDQLRQEEEHDRVEFCRARVAIATLQSYRGGGGRGFWEGVKWKGTGRLRRQQEREWKEERESKATTHVCRSEHPLALGAELNRYTRERGFELRHSWPPICCSSATPQHGQRGMREVGEGFEPWLQAEKNECTRNGIVG